ncbi:MAG: hypothetical protein ACIAQF_11030 [Phycisphaerales bacterium JB065]
MAEASSDKGPLNPSAMTVDDAARLLSGLGSRKIAADRIREDIEAGAPANEDGTVNILHYAAWAAKKIGRRKRG